VYAPAVRGVLNGLYCFCQNSEKSLSLKFLHTRWADCGLSLQAQIQHFDRQEQSFVGVEHLLSFIVNLIALSPSVLHVRGTFQLRVSSEVFDCIRERIFYRPVAPHR